MAGGTVDMRAGKTIPGRNNCEQPNRQTTVAAERITPVSEPCLQLSKQADIAIITFDTPGQRANLMSEQVIRELSDLLDQLEKEKPAGLVFRSGKPGMFIAGADLKVIGSFPKPNAELAEQVSSQGREVIRRLNKTPFPTVAAVEGACAGGGAELSIWCDRRVFSRHKSTQWGFPEVKVGILPAWGGTQRAPRVLGISNAIELCCGGDFVGVDEAQKLGLADDVVDGQDDLLDAAIRLIRHDQKSGEYLKNRETWNRPIQLSDDEKMFLFVTSQGYIMGQTKGMYPAPLTILDVVLNGAQMSIDDGLALESKEFGKLMGSPVSNSLIHVFFMTDRMKKDRGISDESIKPKTIASLGVIGSGIMGHGIAATALKRGIHVTLNDVNAEFLEKGAGKALEIASFNKKTRGPDPKTVVELAPKLASTTDVNDLKDADLVIEAVTENLKVKQKVFSHLEPQMRDDAILASNTSTISITEMAKSCKKPERFIGIHYFNPVHKMQLVEVIRGEKTSDETVATAVKFVQGVGKLPIVVNDGPGFLVNRILFPYMSEACVLLEEGASIRQIDKVAKKFGMPMGPITLYDVVGIDTAFYGGNVMAAAFPDRISDSQIIRALVDQGRLGQKTGKGFFVYEGKNPRGVEDDGIKDIIAEARKSEKQISDEEIRDRLFLPMICEASLILEAGKVRDPADVDAGTIYGFGFPPFHGGVMKYADSLGLDEVCKRLEKYKDCGARFVPTETMKKLAAKGKGFHGK
jgi:3-hydroxyacyl-CoA dehydrogenase/enoyl-CoA hydratase/3-hydroxybutyryl-CoA epimerase/3-hydroxyacyl-CoA dehydrogenase/enoyl-CoA hydratase/3-hydroxybutyryl-CoA epimerase/enoyl-CoA isomerase